MTRPDSDAEQRLVELAGGPPGADRAPLEGVRTLAYYLPQFHPTPENDVWWGPGFTEWTNVTRAQPMFPGHAQPNLPSELGYYDLRVPEVREAQARLAAEHGISGFVYYHYWFGDGRRMLDRPFDEVLASGAPDFPFALCWANHHWTTTWDASRDELLVEQRYPQGDLERHAQWLRRAFSDPRYIRVDDRPLLVIFMVSRLPDSEYVPRLKAACAEHCGVEPYVIQAETVDPTNPHDFGCDAEVEFHPLRLFDFATRLDPEGKLYPGGHVFDYAEVARSHLDRPEPSWRRYPCVVPGWDNSPRRPHDYFCFIGRRADLYEDWLRAVARREQETGDGLVFINAWNEWAEGAYLEPDDRLGRAFLEATRNVFGLRLSEPLAAREPAAGDTGAPPGLAARVVALEREVAALEKRRLDAFRDGERTAEHRLRVLHERLAEMEATAAEQQRTVLDFERHIQAQDQEMEKLRAMIRQGAFGRLLYLLRAIRDAFRRVLARE